MIMATEDVTEKLKFSGALLFSVEWYSSISC
jgi:hypothetical protein